jgi:anthranilate phosphoribosyltransferase
MRLLGSDRRGSCNLTREDAYRAFTAVLSGSESETLVGSFLVTMRWKGVSVEELTGFAQAARDQARIPCQEIAGLVCVSPSQDGHEEHAPLEVVSALIAAAAGCRVLILSDRAVPPHRGMTAANMLECLGLSMTWDPVEAETWVSKGRFAALSVAGMLPALAGLRKVRGDVVVRTPLSTVEKLLAPSSAAVVLGARGGPVLGTAVEVIQGLGHPRGIAVQGIDGSVVPRVRRRTRGIEVDAKHLAPLNVEPADFGLECEKEAELPIFGPPEEGKGPADNPALVKAAGEMCMAVLKGEQGPARNTAILGTALILKAAGRSPTLAECVDAAIGALDTGAAYETLERLRSLIQ